MPPVGFEPAIAASERPQTHAVDRVATAIGLYNNFSIILQAMLTGDVMARYGLLFLPILYSLLQNSDFST